MTHFLFKYNYFFSEYILLLNYNYDYLKRSRFTTLSMFLKSIYKFSALKNNYSIELIYYYSFVLLKNILINFFFKSISINLFISNFLFLINFYSNSNWTNDLLKNDNIYYSFFFSYLMNSNNSIYFLIRDSE
jgi:hypothetical protein